MKRIEKHQKSQAMGRRIFLSGAAALGVDAGLAAPANITRAAAQEPSVIALRDQDLPFTGTIHTATTWLA